MKTIWKWRKTPNNQSVWLITDLSPKQMFTPWLREVLYVRRVRLICEALTEWQQYLQINRQDSYVGFLIQSVRTVGIWCLAKLKGFSIKLQNPQMYSISIIPLTLLASKAILRLLQTILIPVRQLVTGCLTCNQHCLPFSYQHSPNFNYMKNGEVLILNMEESTLNKTTLKELDLSLGGTHPEGWYDIWHPGAESLVWNYLPLHLHNSVRHTPIMDMVHQAQGETENMF